MLSARVVPMLPVAFSAPAVPTPPGALSALVVSMPPVVLSAPVVSMALGVLNVPVVSMALVVLSVRVDPGRRVDLRCRADLRRMGLARRRVALVVGDRVGLLPASDRGTHGRGTRLVDNSLRVRARSNHGVGQGSRLVGRDRARVPERDSPAMALVCNSLQGPPPMCLVRNHIRAKGHRGIQVRAVGPVHRRVVDQPDEARPAVPVRRKPVDPERVTGRAIGPVRNSQVDRKRDAGQVRSKRINRRQDTGRAMGRVRRWPGCRKGCPAGIGVTSRTIRAEHLGTSAAPTSPDRTRRRPRCRFPGGIPPRGATAQRMITR
ncbi:hypothetical protein ATK86_3385 [Nocardia fluminea]|uniref:Uncharacterized protein n=1 Tax=Nocardia fluminea TaxID=134984 RepID=A0A2N3VBL5_9NOCA|nr:hypothetical protein ATK86_3385 [Nocardia fluminea]